ncbi:Protein MAIN-LIKE 2, partial [Camellia lanceoleosa]
ETIQQGKGLIGELCMLQNILRERLSLRHNTVSNSTGRLPTSYRHWRPPTDHPWRPANVAQKSRKRVSRQENRLAEREVVTKRKGGLPPLYHLPNNENKVSSRSTRGYGSILAREWYVELPDIVCQIVDETGFGPFCAGLSRYPASRTLMGALVERWWDTTNSIYFSATMDMTITPFDFSMLTGLGIAGRPVPYDADMGEWETAWIYLLGVRPPIDRSLGRGFLMFLLGTTLFSDRGNTVGFYLLSALVDLSQVSQYDWGGADLATLYCYMSATSRGRGNIVGGYWRAWEPLSCLPKLWVYAYFSTLAPEPEVEAPLEIPYSCRFEGRCWPRPRETLPYLRQFFDTVRPTK